MKLDEKRSEIYLSIIVVVIIIIVSTIVYFYLPSESENGGDDIPDIDRGIKFPEDEGKHKEYFEIWEFFSKFTTDGGHDYEILIRCTNFSTNENVRIEYQLRDIDNQTGNICYSRYVSKGVLTASEKGMDMTFQKGNIKANFTATEGFKYRFTIELEDRFELNFDIDSKKDPILFGEEGKIYKPGFGTIFGYYMPHLKIQGHFAHSDNTIKVSGKGWFEHTWGGEIKSITKEEWQIQLDNDVELFLTKIYDPQKDYPNDLNLHVLNIIRNDGVLRTPRLGQDIFVNTLEYKIVPADEELRKRAWSHKWRFYGDNINLTISPSSQESIQNWTWGGFCEVNGQYYGERVDGYGICELTRRYTSNPQIAELKDDFNPVSPTVPVNVSANITYNPPIEIEMIQLQYRIKEEGWLNFSEWQEKDMHYLEGYWRASIPTQDPGTRIQYKVVIRDTADKRVESDIREYEIPYT